MGTDAAESGMLIETLRAGIKDFLRRPVSSSELEQLLARFRGEPIRAAARNGAVVSFVSNKGGVGKSTLAVNVACGLAMRYPDQVLLIDASLQMGVCASLLNLQPSASLLDAAREPQRLDEMLIRQLAARHESGLHLLASPNDAVEAAEIDDELMSRVLTLARRSYEYVIVDTFPLLDRVVVAVLDHSDRELVVVENVVPTLLGAVRLLSVLDGMGYPRPRRRIVVNRHASLPGGLKPVEIADRLGAEVDYVLPFDKNVIISANTGRPFIERARWMSRYGRALRRMIDDLDYFGKQRREHTAADLNGASFAADAGSLPAVLTTRAAETAQIEETLL
jgi:pilus assembly protein CpaE